MGLFSKKPPTPVAVPTGATEPGFPAVGGDLLDQALDTVAAILRALGRYAFDVASLDREGFARLCEGWVRHVLTGAPLPEEPGPEPEPGTPRSEAKPVRRTGRAWKELQQFVLLHRREEQTFVESRIGELKETVWAFVGGLREIAGADTEMEKIIGGSLTSLEVAVQKGSLEHVRGLVAETSGAIQHAMQRRRAHFEGQLKTLGGRLRALRTDLLEARRTMELDPLTQLHNRGAFDGALGRYVDLSQFAGQALTLLMVDLDHFKQVNDRFGHPAGDRVLVGAAGCLIRAFPRRNDLVARYGGEEFAVLLHDADASAARRLSERLLELMRRMRVKVDGIEEEIEVTCSVGFAELRAGEKGEELVRRADQALYRAKQGGRDRAEQG